MRPPTEAASPVVTDGYGSTSTMYRRIVFWTDLTFSRRSQHAYAVKVATPVNWKQGEDVIIAGSVSDEDAKKTYPQGWKAPKPYIRIVPQPKV
jgi:hypothetical protein